MYTILLYVFYALTVLSVLGIFLIKNVFKAVLLLLVCLLSLSGIYVLELAEFIAVTQVLIYAGGIIVVLIFGIMLTTRISGVPLIVENANIFAAVVIVASFMTLLAVIFSESFKTFPLDSYHVENRVQQTGMQLMTTYVLPFEIAGILLLIALIGAAVVSTSNLEKK
jgi:NADH:ubiquinone oxidoreductase subunit 6 (subunit J)